MIVLAIGLSGCASEPVKEDRYQVRGVFLGQRFEGAAMRVRHEAIPGFMDAMSMDFKLADSSELANLSPGDKVAFVYPSDESPAAKWLAFCPTRCQPAESIPYLLLQSR